MKKFCINAFYFACVGLLALACFFVFANVPSKQVANAEEATVTEIDSIEKLKNISENGNYKLTANLNMGKNDIWTPIASFKGTFDGNGYTISDLKVKTTKISYENGTTVNYAGFFAGTNGATIKNLSISNLTFYGDNITDLQNIKRAGFVANAEETTFTNVQIIGAISFVYKSTGTTNEETIDTTTPENLSFVYGCDVGGLAGCASENSKFENIIATIQYKQNQNLSAGANVYINKGCAVGAMYSSTLDYAKVSITGETTNEQAKKIFAGSINQCAGTWYFYGIDNVTFPSENWNNGSLVCIKPYTIRFAKDDVIIPDEIGESETEKTYSCRYGDKVEISFEIKDGMEKYYSITSVKLGNRIISLADGKIKLNDTINNNYYTMTVDENGKYTFTIKSVNPTTLGMSGASSVDFSVSSEAVKYTFTIKSKLFDADGVQEVKGIKPATIFVGNATTSKETVTISDATYSYSQSFRCELQKSTSPYGFVGWYLEGYTDENGVEKAIGRENEIKYTLVFQNDEAIKSLVESGKKEFVIYAKYLDNSCVITFKMGDGIKEVDVESTPIEGTTYAVSKKGTSIKLEIFIEDNYSFDVENFLTQLNTYYGKSADSEFCHWGNKNDQSVANQYIFYLNMTELKDDYATGFALDTIGYEIAPKSNNNRLVVIILISVASVAFVAIVTVLIIVLVRKHNGLGGAPKEKRLSRKDYKNYY